MADPATLGVIITGLVSAYKAYAEYRAVAVKAEAERKAAPAKSAEVEKGEQVAQVVKTGIEKYGNVDERADLANFERNPERYHNGFIDVLSDVAKRNPDFASQLQTIAQQANIQTGGVQGSVNNSGKIEGNVAGVNTGTMNYTKGKKDS